MISETIPTYIFRFYIYTKIFTITSIYFISTHIDIKGYVPQENFSEMK